MRCNSLAAPFLALPVRSAMSRAAERLEKERAGADDVTTLGRLTIAWHELSLLLAEEFYPG